MGEPADPAFYQGIALAVASLARSGEPTLAAGILSGHAILLSDFVKARVDSYDLREIRKLYQTESQLRQEQSHG